jgi:hypothetical protein
MKEHKRTAWGNKIVQCHSFDGSYSTELNYTFIKRYQIAHLKLINLHVKYMSEM